MSLKQLQSWVRDCGIANEVPTSTYILQLKRAVNIATKLQAEVEWMAPYVEQVQGCNWREIMKQALKGK